MAKDFWISTFIPFSAAVAAAGVLVPLFILAIGGSVADLGWLTALGSGISLPLAFIWGKLTDDSGQRKIFIILMFISGFGISIGYFFSNTFVWLIVLAVLTGLLIGSGDTARNMYIYDKYPESEWEETISKFHQRSGIGSCAGLLFGGIFLYFSNEFALFFLICAILCAISAILGFFFIKEVSTEKVRHKKDKMTDMKLAFYSSTYELHKIRPTKVQRDEDLRARVILFLIGTFVLYLAFNLIFTPLPAFMLEELKIAEYLIFWVYLGYFAISVVGYSFAGNWIDKKGNRTVLFIGLFTRIVVYSGFAIFSLFIVNVAGGPSALVIVIILLIFGGIAFSLMNVALQNTLPRLIKKDLGEVLGVYYIVIGLSAIVGSFFSGFIAEFLSYAWLFLIAVICTVIAFAIYFKIVKKRGLPPSE